MALVNIRQAPDRTFKYALIFTKVKSWVKFGSSVVPCDGKSRAAQLSRHAALGREHCVTSQITASKETTLLANRLIKKSKLALIVYLDFAKV